MAKMGYYAEHRRQLFLEEQGYIVLRVSGSIGFYDLVVISRDPSTVNNSFRLWLEQVKSTNSDIFYFDKRSKDEWERAYDFWRKTGIATFFLVLFKNHGWSPSVLVSGQMPKKIEFDRVTP